MSANARDPRVLQLLVDLVVGAWVPRICCKWCGGWRPAPGDRCYDCGAPLDPRYRLPDVEN